MVIEQQFLLEKCKPELTELQNIIWRGGNCTDRPNGRQAVVGAHPKLRSVTVTLGDHGPRTQRERKMSAECEGGDWNTRHFDWVDYCVFGATLFVSLGIGVFHGFFSEGKQRTTAEFASAISILGNAAEMYYYSTQYITTLSSFIIMVPFTVNLFLPVMRELGITSIYEYLDRRFSNFARLLVAFLYFLMMLMYISVVVYAPALALRQVTGIGTMYAVGLIFVVGTLYSSLGGLKAVVWSDVFQAVVIMAALIMVVVRGFNPDPRARHTVWTTVIGCSIYWIGMNAATQTVLQRLLSVPTQREASLAVWLSCLGMFVIFVPTFYLGLLMYSHFQRCDPLLSKAIDASDQMLPLYVMEVAGNLPGLPGLFVAGVFSAALSTVASALNAVSASMLRDMLDGGLGYRPPDDHAALVTRIMSALFGLLSFGLTFLVSQLGGVLQIALSFNGMVIGVVLAVFTLGIDDVFDGYRLSYLWYTPLGCIITMITGVLASLMFDRNSHLNLDPALLSPLIRRWFVKAEKMKEVCTGGDWDTRFFNWADYLVFGAVLLVSLGIGVFHGFFAGNKQNTTAELLMGNKQMNYWSLGVSLTVGFASAISILGNASEMYNYGTQYAMTLIAFIIMVPFTVNLFLPVMRELNITSIYEYLDRRYSNIARLLVAFLYFFMMLMYISVVVYAPALALRQVTGIGTFYAGGIKAVVWSDVFLACVIMAALIMVLVRGTMADGGPSIIWENARNSTRIEFFIMNPDPRIRHSFWTTIVGASFYWIGMNAATQTCLQRLLAVSTQREALKAVCLSGLGMYFIYVPTFYLGLLMYTHFIDLDASDQMLPLYVMDVAGSLPGLPGLFVAGVFSAALSTVGSALNAVAASMLRDLLQGGLGYKPPEARAALVTRLLSAVFGLLSFCLTFLVAQLGGVLQIAISFNGMVIGVVLGIFMLGMWVPWSNTKGMLTGAIIALTIVLWFGFGAQIATLSGELVQPRKPVGTNCDCEVVMPEYPPISTRSITMSGECTGQDWEARRFHWADYLTFGSTLLVSVGFGIFHGFFAKRKNTTAEFLMGNKQMNYLTLGLSLTVGFASSIALLGNVAEVYNYGTQFALSLISAILMMPFTLNLFLPVLRELQITSVYEYLEQRYNNAVRFFITVVYLLHVLTYVSVVVYAPALALEQVTGIKTMYAVAIIFAVGIFYSSLGGVKAAVGSDIFQLAVLMIGMIALLIRGSIVDGGPAVAWKAAYESDRLELFIMDPNPLVRHTFWSVLIGCTFYWIGMTTGQATQQRLLAIPTQRDTAKALLLSCLAIVVVYGITFYYGLMVYVHYQSCDPLLSKSIHASDQILPLYLMDILGDFHGLPGLMVAGIFSASLGTLSMSLSGVSAIFLRDVLHGWFNYRPSTEQRATLITRLVSVIFGLLSFAFTFIIAQLDGLMQVFNGYRISYLWYTPLGWFVTMVISIAASLLWDNKSHQCIDPKLLAPIVRSWFVNNLTILLHKIMSGECTGQDWEAHRFHWADYLTFGFALLVSVGFGIFHGFFAKRKNTTAEFLMGNKQMNYLTLGLSLTVGFASSIGLLGNVAEAYNYGTQFALSLICPILLSPLTLNLFLPVLRELQITSVYEYLERRFNNKLRLFVTAVYLLQALMYMSVVVYAPALALEQVTGIKTMYAVGIIFAVGIFYSSLGGVKAAVGSDIFQLAVLMIGMIALLIRGSIVDGGPAVVWNTAYESDRLELFIMDPDPRVRHTFWSVLIGNMFYWVGMTTGQVKPHNNDCSLFLHRETVPTSTAITVIYLITNYYGLMAYVHYQSCDPLLSKSIEASDQLLPLYLMDILGDYHGLPGLMVAGIFSASLGTLSMYLSGVSAIVLRDVLVGGFNYRPSTEQRATLITRLISVIFGLLSFAFTFIIAQLDGCVDGFCDWLVYRELACYWCNNGQNEVFDGYRISYLWYSPLGWFLTVTLSTVASLLWDNKSHRVIDPNLLATSVRSWFVKAYTFLLQKIMSGECTGQDWEARRFHWADYLTFGFTLLVSVGFGIFHGFFAKRKNTTAEFLMGDKQINSFSLGLSLTLGFASSVAILGNVAEMYNFGTQFALSLVSTLTMVPFTLNLFLPVFRELEVTSYLDRRFSIGVRLFTAILYILQMLIFVAVVVYAPALALRQVTGIETMYAVAIIFAVGIFYSSLGGLKAAVGTDIFQFAVLMTGVIAMLVRATMIDGGPQTIWNAAYESDRLELFIMDPDPRVRHTFWSVLIGSGFYWVGMNSGQATFQRLLASIDAPDQIYPLYMMEILGDMPGLAGLLVSGIFSASLGTLAMSLNGVSANILRDVLDGGFNYRPATEQKATLITRLLNVTFGLLSFGLTFVIAITFNGVVVGVTLAVFTLAMYVPWSNSKGVLTGSVISFSIVCWLAMGAQVSTLQGKLVHERKEVGLDCQCNVEEPDIPPQDEVFDGYRISYLWYSPLGWFLTVTLSTIASLLWDNRSHQVIDPNLLATSVRSWFVKLKEQSQKPISIQRYYYDLRHIILKIYVYSAMKESRLLNFRLTKFNTYNKIAFLVEKTILFKCGKNNYTNCKDRIGMNVKKARFKIYVSSQILDYNCIETIFYQVLIMMLINILKIA
ncbi:hypothetical protein B566_EDAN013655 [Ephemera danica]|nr:hypothetical protein B566_EDAN013655 [Ephemera danica]